MKFDFYFFIIVIYNNPIQSNKTMSSRDAARAFEANVAHASYDYGRNTMNNVTPIHVSSAQMNAMNQFNPDGSMTAAGLAAFNAQLNRGGVHRRRSRAHRSRAHRSRAHRSRAHRSRAHRLRK